MGRRPHLHDSHTRGRRATEATAAEEVDMMDEPPIWDPLRHGNMKNQSTGDQMSFATNSDLDDSESEPDEVQEIRNAAQQDTNLVHRWRFLMHLALFFVGVAVSVASYELLTNEEDSNSDNAWDQFSLTVTNAALDHMLDVRAGLTTLSEAVSGAAYQEFQQRQSQSPQLPSEASSLWPFFVMPLFEQHGSNALQQTQLHTVLLCPLVAHHQRFAWTDFARDQYNASITESHLLGPAGNLDAWVDRTYTPYISKWQIDGGVPSLVPDEVREYYAPLWHKSRPLASTRALNFNLASLRDTAPLIPALQQLPEPELVLTPFRDIGGNDTSKTTRSALEDLEIPGLLPSPIPHSLAWFPLLEDPFIQSTLNNSIVGVAVGALVWETWFRNLLPPHVRGIVAVLDNTCGQVITFGLEEGGTVRFLGNTDAHDRDYDFKERQVHLAVHTTLEFPMTPGHCQYSLRLYPSSTFENDFKSQLPRKFGVLVAVAFCVVILIFACYDFFVRARNDKLIAKAAHSHAIVTSLFPRTIRDQYALDHPPTRYRRSPHLYYKEDAPVTIPHNNIKSSPLQNATNGSSTNTEPPPPPPPSRGLSMRRISVGIGGGSISVGIGGKDISVGLSGVNVGNNNSTEGRDQTSNFRGGGTSSRLKSFLMQSSEAPEPSDNKKPLADFYLETTVLYANISGFTAWSSMREPSQVFTLLETVFGRIDKLAKKRRIFKVETVGDCYVAVCGLPEPRKDHVVLMCRFAREVMAQFQQLVRQLEVQLGPDTGDLCMRMGMHSGPVTAGVLRGERARFQLFGNTMKIAAQIESMGKRDMIHLSNETAEKLQASGKGGWLTLRAEPIQVTGRGMVASYWLKTLSDVKDDMSQSGDNTVRGDRGERGDHSIFQLSSQQLNFFGDSENEVDPTRFSERESRLIDWNTATLFTILQQIVARRQTREGTYMAEEPDEKNLPDPHALHCGETFLEEVREIIHLPEFDGGGGWRSQQNYESTKIESSVCFQLRDFVTCVAKMYRNNPFHNFEHASHVVMSVTKLLARIVAPTDIEDEIINTTATWMHRKPQSHDKAIAATLHDHTYGITSDPLTQFACAISALIHDIDHPGVPNTRLIEENPQLGQIYKGRSVAEQNSLALAWQLFIDKRYDQLRNTICSTQDELIRFRELLVNSVMATDVGDQDLKKLRNARWEKAFSSTAKAGNGDGFTCSTITGEEESLYDAVNRKATIVIEHIIQASDISHTMQHWHIYRKWNARLFEELYKAYQNGRSTSNPATFWAKGELGFFDFYIIPLAKKLKDCGVFGVSSDEFLDYAKHNRREWEDKGEQIVAEMLQELSHRSSRQITLADFPELIADDSHDCPTDKPPSALLINDLKNPQSPEQVVAASDTASPGLSEEEVDPLIVNASPSVGNSA